MQDYRRLSVWAKSHELVLEVYRATSQPPDRSDAELALQARSAAAAIPVSIADGCSHALRRDFVRCLQVAAASASVLDYRLRLLHDLDLLNATGYAKLEARTTQVRQMLAGLMRRVRSVDAEELARSPEKGRVSTKAAPMADDGRRTVSRRLPSGGPAGSEGPEGPAGSEGPEG